MEEEIIFPATCMQRGYLRCLEGDPGGDWHPGTGIHIHGIMLSKHCEKYRGEKNSESTTGDIIPNQTMHCCKCCKGIPQNYHRFVLFDTSKMGNLMTLVLHLPS